MPETKHDIIELYVSKGKDMAGMEACAKKSAWAQNEYKEQKAEMIAQKQKAVADQTAIMSVKRVAAILEITKKKNGSYPRTLAEIEATTKQPLRDPWKHEFRYKRTATGYQVCSNGADGVPSTADDHCHNK